MDGLIQESDGGIPSRDHLVVAKGSCEEVFLENYDRLVRFLCMRLGSLELARDIAQETILKALEASDRFDRNLESWPWLKAIAVNTAIDHLRRTGRELAIEDFPEVGDLGSSSNSEDALMIDETLKALPSRQRIALSLRYLSDWNSSDAANFLGVSRSGFDQLVSRAKKRFSLEYRRLEKSVQGLAALTTLRLRMRARLSRVRQGLDNGSGLSLLTAEQVSAALAALIFVTAGPSSIAPHDPALPAPAEFRQPFGVASGDTPSKHKDRQGASRTRTAATGQARSESPGMERTLVDDFTDPNGNVEQPEDVKLTSFAAGGKNGELVYAAGTTHCRTGICPPVLFRSEDLGATWQRLPATGFTGWQVATPPADDLKLFAMGPNGLHISSDGGETFGPALPTGVPMTTGSLAVSPLFHRGDPTVLIGAQTLMRYSDGDGLMNPYPGSLTGPFEPVFSPAFGSDSLFLLGGLRHGSLDGLVSTVYICNSHGCNYRELASRDQVPRLRPLGDGKTLHSVVAFTQDDIYVSGGDLDHFQALELSWQKGLIMDVEVAPGRFLIASVVAAEKGAPQGLYISRDGGGSWTKVDSPLVNSGAEEIVLLDNGRVLVALANAGIACSSDGGQTFRRRCA